MIIGVPQEVKNNEYRVAMVPAGVKELVNRGHQVVVQSTAGEGVGVSDEAYEQAGAQILSSAKEIYGKAEMIVKVKEPIESEYDLIRPGQIIFGYFHFASSRQLTDAMIKSKSTCLAYETVTGPYGHPLLTPMSEIAGRLSVQQAAKYLERPSGGRGTLMGGVPGVKAARVMVIGGGVVGTNAAKIAAGMGARVTIMDINLERLRYLDDVMPKNISTLYNSELNLLDQLKSADVVIGGVYIGGARAPRIIRREHLKTMHRGAVLVDVAIDQGGCFETSKPTTHSDPIYEIDGIIHYCVSNMPGAVARTSTFALTNATLPRVIHIANEGWPQCIKNDEHLRNGLNIVDGKVTCPGVAEAFDLELHPYEIAT